MDPVSISMVAAATGAITGTVTNRVVPNIFEIIRNKIRGFFFKTVTLTLSQNKQKTINFLKFITNFPQFKHSNCNIVIIDNQEYEIPTGDFELPVKGFKFKFSVHTDMQQNISHVVVSTWKRNTSGINAERLAVFDKFLKKFPSTADDGFNPVKLATKIINAMAIPIKAITCGLKFRAIRKPIKQLKINNENEHEQYIFDPLDAFSFNFI